MGFISKGWLTGLLHGFVLGAVSIGLMFAILIFTGQAKVAGVDEVKLLTFTMLIEFISVGMMAFSEEVLMRGYLMTALKPTRNKGIIFLAPSILFSLFHLMNPGITFLSLLNTFLAGMLFAYMFIQSGKLWLSSGFHIAWNFFQGDIFGMNVSGNTQTAIFETKLGTNELLTGGNYGPEGGILVTCVLLLGFVYVRFILKRPNDPTWTMESDLPFVRGEL
jgi:membrane protease YdiL (CAAX protease family)